MTLEEKVKPYIEKYEKFQANQKPVINKSSMPLERKPAYLDFEESIGGTTYIVKSFFDDNSKEDMFRKVVRLMSDSKVNKNNNTA